MMLDPLIFNLELNNIPVINLRLEFNNFLQLLKNEEFQKHFHGEIKPIETPYFIWFGMPSDLLNLLVQKAILGLESYIPTSVWLQSVHRGINTNELNKKIFNPSKLNGRGTADNIYNKLPAILDGKLKMCESNNDLWEKVKKFYKQVRNPIFHGYQIVNMDAIPVLNVYEFVKEIYQWVDSWHSFDDFLPKDHSATINE